MARYNTTASTATVSGAGTQVAPANGLFTQLTGTAPYTLTIANPTLFTGTTQTFFNATSGTITLSSPSGVFKGPAGSNSASQTVVAGGTIILASDGTNYVVVLGSGGPISGTTLDVSSTVNLNPANATVTVSPTGTGTVTMSPGTAGTINNMSIGATTRATGAFTTLGANSTVTLSPANAAVTISPTGTGATVTISPAVTGSLDNTAIGGSTRAAGAFTTLTSNAATTFTQGTASTSSGTGTLKVTGGIGATGNIYIDGMINANLLENIQASSYTLTLADAGYVIAIASGTLTVPNLSWPVGTQIQVYANTATNAAVTLAAGSGVTLTASGTFSGYEIINLRYRGSATWAVTHVATVGAPSLSGSGYTQSGGVVNFSSSGSLTFS
jgi:hypothetical protein